MYYILDEASRQEALATLRAAWALSLLQAKHKPSGDLSVPSLVANVTKAHTEAHHIYLIILTQAN